jgi:hypothetical protein
MKFKFVPNSRNYRTRKEEKDLEKGLMFAFSIVGGSEIKIGDYAPKNNGHLTAAQSSSSAASGDYCDKK